MNKISVIVPFYNSSNTLERCLKSILEQTYTNFEILCVNDGSTDCSEKLVKEYAAKDKRVKLINKKHGGVSSARNLGLKRAKGDFIQFVDSDDFIEPRMYEIMLNAMLENNADTVVCDFTHPCFRNYLGNAVLDLTKKSDMLKYLQTTFASLVPWNKLYRRNTLTEPFDEELSFAEDDLFTMVNAFNCKKLVGVSDVLYHYYIKPANTGEKSALNKLANPETCNNKDTIWYKRTSLFEKNKAGLLKFMSEEEAEEYAYIRVFDFIFWEFFILVVNGADKISLEKEMLNVFSEKQFTECLKIKEKKYGVNFRNFKNEQSRLKIKLFADVCYDVCCETMTKNSIIRPFYACLGVFVKLFVSDSDNADTNDIVAECLYNLKTNGTREAKYVNNLEFESVVA